MRNLTIRFKVLFGFLFAGIVPILIIYFISVSRSEAALEHEQFNKLIAVKDIKIKMVESFFSERIGDATVLAANPFVRESYTALNDIYSSAVLEEGKRVNGSGNYNYTAPNDYREVHDRYHQDLRFYMDQYGYYDLFFISADGDILYSVFKESDFGTNLNNLSSSLQDVWRKSAASSKSSISDMKPYSPSGGVPAIFVSSPIMDGGTTIGYVALQVSNEMINELMQMNAGLGETGKTYLVSRQGGNPVLVNDRRDGKKIGDVLNSDEARKAVNGESGEHISDDGSLIYTYKPIKIEGLDWGMIGEMSMEEIDRPVVELSNIILYISLALLALVVFLGVVLSKNISREIAKLNNFFNELANKVYRGKFKEDFEQDDIGVDFQPIMDSGISVVKAFVNTLDNMPVPFFTVDTKFNFQFMNKLAMQIGGLDDFRGKTCYSVMRASDCNSEKCATGKCMRTEQMEESETYANPTNGKEYEIKYYGTPLKDEEGNVVGGIEILLDQTAEIMAKRKEAKIKSFQNSEVNELNGVLEKVSEGDLTVSYHPKDCDEDTQLSYDTFSEISTILNKVIKTLSGIMKEVYSSSRQVSEATGQVSSASQSLSSGTTEQASSIEQISSSLQEVLSQVSQTTENSTESKKLSDGSLQVTIEGNKKMDLLVSAMDEIKNSSAEISKIIKTIDEIAFQTNLLALNAAVEAARAGKHGKGFAVVAEEVRTLAARSSKAAKETSELIENSISKVNNGVGFVTETNNALKEIEDSFKKLNVLVDEVAEASHDQNLKIREVNTGVDQINSVTQQNAANAEETAAAAEEMQSQAETLASIIGRFKTDDSDSHSYQNNQIHQIEDRDVRLLDY